MDPDRVYHPGQRELQDRYDSRRLADRLAERLTRPALQDEDREFIARLPFFFLASADPEGQPDVSYKGGVPGFVRTPDATTIEFDHYDGNGMFRSLGNLLVQPKVALLFIDFEQPKRLRVLGQAALAYGPEPRVRVAVEAVFPNCPRYVHPMRSEGISPYAPRPGHVPPEPAWKSYEMFRDVLPRKP